MKKIEAFVRHEAFEPIREDLLEKGIPSMTVTEVKGSGRQRGIVETYRGAQLTNHLRPKIKIEIAVADAEVDLVVNTILEHAKTGNVGDGKIFVLPVEAAYRVRTGETGEDVLQAHEGDEA
jgi:nitrogen regulatory protein P-II 1